MPDLLTRHLFISGRVQGVGFRDALHAEARRAGVRGWVRNRRDGRVEAVLQGTPAQLQPVLAWARRGPDLARVRDVSESEARDDFARIYPGFERMPTL